MDGELTMTNITINGKTIPTPVLTYGQVKTTPEAFKAPIAEGLDLDQRLAASVQSLLAAGFSQDDLDGTSPGFLIDAAQKLYMAAYSRPEAEAPAPASTNA